MGNRRNKFILFNWLQRAIGIALIASYALAVYSVINTNDITTLIKNQLDDMIKWSVESISVTGAGSHNITYSMGNMMLYVMEPDTNSLNTAKNQIQQYMK